MNKRDLFFRRQSRNRYWIKQRNKENRPRLSIFRSARHIYAQLIDDSQGKTIAAASTVDKVYRQTYPQGQPKFPAAQTIGKRIAELSLSLGVDKVVFDRGSYPYHGRIKSLAESARQQGLSF